jgi:hypothetical protein
MKTLHYFFCKGSDDPVAAVSDFIKERSEVEFRVHSIRTDSCPDIVFLIQHDAPTWQHGFHDPVVNLSVANTFFAAVLNHNITELSLNPVILSPLHHVDYDPMSARVAIAIMNEFMRYCDASRYDVDGFLWYSDTLYNGMWDRIGLTQISDPNLDGECALLAVLFNWEEL